MRWSISGAWIQPRVGILIPPPLSCLVSHTDCSALLSDNGPTRLSLWHARTRINDELGKRLSLAVV
ncbi:Uncharacterized protein APZ42_032541 [Daphnia magna]|uniref:Uncharacterized protein n=1 Tax=Daphnia magna TaxID=35525 RepID=A0A164LMM3_9CRUS|nr:Uncharacterized protein APZ42_032541 [Daphnia magna]